MFGFEFLPAVVKSNGDNLIWLGAVALAITALIALWRQVRKWRPIAGSIDKAKAVIVAVWRIVFGTPIENRRKRNHERYVGPLLNDLETRIAGKLDEQTDRNDKQHAVVETRLGDVDEKVAALDTKVGAIGHRLGLVEKYTAWPERQEGP